MNKFIIFDEPLTWHNSKTNLDTTQFLAFIMHLTTITSFLNLSENLELKNPEYSMYKYVSELCI